ncbi:hypothetical protein BAY61_07370 [Prauserella marina]|uniref:Uncharacterized protein n=1 Tax=Prauserella marina TaxID=530584 RepID=A0A222VM36_9PSEU|nr:DUF4383 domain-containing protein [Prauserella marina]ASR34823.1 hypothetical protein BAY61_07370 [Prauserella marina]PWV85483.1 uncharacterized protein DUF4383 [Prauserella marina]SDC53752.1 protein of unknown function [Prauserella marina]
MDRPTQTQVRVSGFQPAQLLAGLVGLVYLAFGIVGLVITGFGGFTAAQHSMLLGFSVNPLHNVVSIVVGVLGLLFATRSGLARTYGWLLFLGFGVLLVWGMAITGVFSSNPVSGLGNPLALNTADNWLHLGTALVGLLIAVLPARKRIVQTTDPGAASADLGATRTDVAADQPVQDRPAHRKVWRRGAAT